MNVSAARELFQCYVSQYDLTNEKIRLKVRHTFGVVSCSEYLADAMGLEEEDRQLAQMIALLHDIGRFEQLRRFNSFDDRLMPHAQCSLDVLFDQGMIREFIPETRAFDEVIFTAIKNHGVFRMEELPEGRTKLHSLLIRDADKLDNFYVKEKEEIVTMLDVTAEEAAGELVTDRIYECIRKRQPVLNSDRVTHLDIWVFYIGYIFDLNYNESCRYVLEKDSISKILARIPYRLPETRQRMKAIEEDAMAYLKERAAKCPVHPLRNDGHGKPIMT